MELREKLQQGNLQMEVEDYELEDDGIIRYRGKIYVSNSQTLKDIILG
jgi:hypothetical protein